MLSQVKAITFDFTHTLASYKVSYSKIYADTLATIGIKTDFHDLGKQCYQAFIECGLEPIKNVHEITNKSLYENLIHATIRQVCNPQQLIESSEAIWAAFSKAIYWKTKPYIQETIELLRRQGYAVYLLSNWDYRLRALVQELKWQSLFDGIFLASEIGFEKPNINIFSHVQQTLKCKANQILHVGDELVSDYLGAKKAGWQAMWLKGNRTELGNPSTQGMQYIYEMLPLLSGAKGSVSMGSFHEKMTRLPGLFQETTQQTTAFYKRRLTHVRDCINHLIETHGLNATRVEAVIMENWKDIVGASIAHRCSPKSITKKNILVLKATNPVIRQELLFQSNAILEKIRKLPGCNAIQQLIFTME
jgi:putative hydrolase of the HAD superfamily